jgi:peptidoglycan hydrolase CwlO-like protein
MQDRIDNLENLMRLYADFAEQMAATQERLDASQRRMSQNQQRIAENLQQIAENQQYLDESQRRTGDLIQQILQAVAVMQADIVRIDETHLQ